MKKTVIFTVIFVFLSCLGVRAEEISLTLDEAISIALRDNHDLLLKQDDVKKAKAKIKEANSGLFPTLTFTAGVNRTTGYYAKDLTQTTTQTTLKQYLYKGGETINTIKKNEYDLEVSQAKLDDAKLDIITEVEKAFYTLSLAEEFSQLNKSIVDNIQENLDSLKERYLDGLASESDILNIESSLENAKNVYQVSLSQVESSRALLNNLLYLDTDTMLTADADFTYEMLDVVYEESLLIEAIKNRPEIKQYEAQIKSDKKSVEIAKADNRPSIYASWDYYSRSHTAAASRNWNDYSVIGMTFSWPIFDGWLTKAKVEQAIIDLRETQITKEKTVKDISLELKDAYLSLKDAIAKIGTVDADIKVYGDNFATAKSRYERGLISRIDINDASLKYDIVMFNKKQSIYDYIVAKIDFEKATGGLR